MIKLGCDICGRVGIAHLTVTDNVETKTGKSGNITTTEIATPYGKLTSISEYLPEQETVYERKFLWGNFKKEYKAIRHLLSNTEYIFDHDKAAKCLQQVGNNGVMLTPIECCFIKKMHFLAGAVQTSYFLLDYEKEMKELQEIYEEKILRLVRQAVKSELLAFISCDNLDSPFWPLNFIDKYCLNFLKKEAEIIHAHGKYFFDHACGNLKNIKSKIRESGFDGLEAITHPPVGDITLKEAREIDDGFVVIGGITAIEQKKFNNDKTLIDAYVKNLFKDLQPLKGFIFSTGCNTTITTSYDTLRYFRDACWKYGTI